MTQRCIACHAQFPLDRIVYTCPQCDGLLEIAIEPATLAQCPWPPTRSRGVWRYEAFLPASAADAVTLGEGDTGLHAIPTLGRALGIPRLFLKHEGENPTGSFKDRGMTVGMTVARRLGARIVGCASTGNTSASLAAYAARAGLRAVVFVPRGKIALGKLAQAVVHGAEITQIDGGFDDCLRLLRDLSTARGEIYLLNSINPFRLEGQKTIAYEVCEQLGGKPPDAIVLPLGNAGNISAIWKGWRELHDAGRIQRLPRMIGVQASGAAPIARLLAGELDSPSVANPETVATAIRIGAPASAPKALAAIRESHGAAGHVSDDEILAAQARLARTEGLFVEPASAAPLAWLAKTRLDADTVVCVATGHGLKDPDAVLRSAPEMKRAAPTLESLRRVLELA
jgi:threonine synthase